MTVEERFENIEHITGGRIESLVSAMGQSFQERQGPL
jgi:hypothetical protein